MAYWERERAERVQESEVEWVMTRKQCLLDTTGQLQYKFKVVEESSTRPVGAGTASAPSSNRL